MMGSPGCSLAVLVDSGFSGGSSGSGDREATAAATMMTSTTTSTPLLMEGGQGVEVAVPGSGKVGMLLLWPGYSRHSVPAHNGTRPRIAVSFNIWLTRPTEDVAWCEEALEIGRLTRQQGKG